MKRKNLHHSPRSPNSHQAFSLIELLVVLSVGLLLVIMAVPTFSRLAKKSKVHQTAETLISAFNMASMISQQMCRPEAVVTYFGDDFSSVNTKPTVGVLPKYGNIEIWSAKMGKVNQKTPYWSGGDALAKYWIPFHTPLEPLTVESFTFPEGIRVLAGYCNRFGAGTTASPYTYKFVFSHFDKSSSIGEIKRHCIVTVQGKGFAQFDDTGTNNGGHSYADVLVFDVATGEHLVIRATGGGEFNTSGNSASNAPRTQDHKARILTDRVTHEDIQISTIRKPATSTVNVYSDYPIANKNIQAQIDN